MGARLAAIVASITYNRMSSVRLTQGSQLTRLGFVMSHHRYESLPSTSFVARRAYDSTMFASDTAKACCIAQPYNAAVPVQETTSAYGISSVQSSYDHMTRIIRSKARLFWVLSDTNVDKRKPSIVWRQFVRTYLMLQAKRSANSMAIVQNAEGHC